MWPSLHPLSDLTPRSKHAKSLVHTRPQPICTHGKSPIRGQKCPCKSSVSSDFSACRRDPSAGAHSRTPIVHSDPLSTFASKRSHSGFQNRTFCISTCRETAFHVRKHLVSACKHAFTHAFGRHVRKWPLGGKFRPTVHSEALFIGVLRIRLHIHADTQDIKVHHTTHSCKSTYFTRGFHVGRLHILDS